MINKKKMTGSKFPPKALIFLYQTLMIISTCDASQRNGQNIPFLAGKSA